MSIVSTVKEIAKRGTTEVVKHSPEILTGMCVAGTITTVIFAVKATPEAIRMIDEAAERKYIDEQGEDSDLTYYDWLECYDEGSSCIELMPRLRVLTPLEIVKATWKCYLPPVIVGAVTIGCGIGAHSIDARRNAVLASAYSIVDEAFNDYKSHVVEQLGEEKHQEVVDEIAKDKIQVIPDDDTLVAINGEHKCFDSLSGRYFKSDLQKIRSAINDFNEELINDFYGSMNDWYFCLGIPGVDKSVGDELGWNTDNLLKISFSSQITLRDEPCLVLVYDTVPRPDFR